MKLYVDQGVVLRTWKLREADRIVVLLTKDHGKVRAVAKGVRKTKSKFGSRLEPTSHIAIQLYPGRELDTVTQVDSIDHFRPIREDLDRLSKAILMLEAVDQLALEREPNPELYRMLVGALRALSTRCSPLVASSFLLKALSLEGFRPVVDECVGCGATDHLVAFEAGAGGVLCKRCRRGRALSPETLSLLQRILGGQLASALDEAPSSATAELEDLARGLTEHHLERRLRSASADLAG